MRMYYSLTTLDPIVLSQTNATTNNHECLDYIPGSAILGALAAQLYPELSHSESWDMFHSGAVKFGPCFPAEHNQLALPIPASWHITKGQSAFSGDTLNKTAIYNQSNVEFQREDGVQYKQCREGYITANASAANVKKGITVRTAVDRLTGIAKNGSLFSYSYLSEKQTFIGWVESDSPDYLAKIRTKLTGQLNIGRSRNTEFGRVEIKPFLDVLPPKPDSNQEYLTLWCLNDCQCLDQQGLPTFVPNINELIPGALGELNKQRSFIRTNKVSRFNQKRRGSDSEQLLISKGSVLVYKLLNPLSQQQLDELQKNGMGINQHQGLGWIMVNPAWASTCHLSEEKLFHSIDLPKSAKLSFSSQPNSALTNWVARQCEKESNKMDAQTQVDELITLIGQAYRNARQYNRILQSYQAGPSSNQWRRISNELRNANLSWVDALFNEENGICKEKNDELGWGITWDNGQGLISFAAFVKKILSHQPEHVVLALISRINRYDFSTFKGLTKASKELGFNLALENNNHQETAQ